MASPTASTSQNPLDRRLYVGGLADTVDEYMLTKLFSKYGRITKLDFLFHTSGPLKGRPRGYAFIELESLEQASTAIQETHNKLLRGKRISVSFAENEQQIANNSFEYITDSQGLRRRVRRQHIQSAKPTPLSILKTSAKPLSTEAKIKALEEKLEKLKQTPTLLEDQDTGPSRKTIIPENANLPAKPEHFPGAFDASSGVGEEARRREGTLSQSADVLRLAKSRKMF